jgi:hypothetical protein
MGEADAVAALRTSQAPPGLDLAQNDEGSRSTHVLPDVESVEVCAAAGGPACAVGTSGWHPPAARASGRTLRPSRQRRRVVNAVVTRPRPFVASKK